MKPLLRRSLEGLVVAGGLALLAGLSGWRLGTVGERAALRVAFSARPERIERCREVSAEELASRPAHMRQLLECEGRSATYRLTVRLDDSVLADGVLAGGGVRHDRPLTVLEEFPVVPGERRLQVLVTRVEAVDSDDVSLSDSTRRPRHPPLPRRLELADTVLLDRGRVVLVTYDPEARRLLLRTGNDLPAPPAAGERND